MGSEALLIRYLVIVAHRLDSFRWVARWPDALRGDIFATDSELGLGPTPTPNTQEAVRSACPTSIAVVDEDSKIVQFSSSEVKEFLTSNRLPTLYPNISKYHISPEIAHAALSRACINL